MLLTTDHSPQHLVPSAVS